MLATRRRFRRRNGNQILAGEGGVNESARRPGEARSELRRGRPEFDEAVGEARRREHVGVAAEGDACDGCRGREQRLADGGSARRVPALDDA